jgi:hypothetical protein
MVQCGECQRLNYGHASSPLFFVARGTPTSLYSPSRRKPKGTERRLALRLGCRLSAESPLARTRAFRRSIAAVTARAALSIRLLGVPPGCPRAGPARRPAASLRGPLRSRAVPPCRPSARPTLGLTSGRRIADVGFTRYRPNQGGPAIQTSHDDALWNGPDNSAYSPIGI